MSRYEKLRKALKQDIRPEHHDYAELSAVWDGIHTVVADVAREMLQDEYTYRKWHNFYEATLDRIVYEAIARINRMATGPVGTREEEGC